MADVKFGIYQLAAGGTVGGKDPRWEDLKRNVLIAEEAGFDSVWTADHFQRPAGIWEMWTLLSAFAAVTERIELGSLVACMGYRNPPLLAKMADTLDEVSGGRYILGVGAGDAKAEHDAFGYPYHHLYSRFVEGIQIVSDLIRKGEADFQGKFYQVSGAYLHPRGPRGGDIPIMIGAGGPKMLRQVARFADMWNSDWTLSYAEVADQNAELTRACEEVGRDPSTLLRTASVRVELPGSTGRGSGNPVWNATGNPMSTDQLVQVLSEYHENGFGKLIVWIDPNTPDGIERFAPVIEQMKRP